jgi:hypothetical protein
MAQCARPRSKVHSYNVPGRPATSVGPTDTKPAFSSTLWDATFSLLVFALSVLKPDCSTASPYRRSRARYRPAVRYSVAGFPPRRGRTRSQVHSTVANMGRLAAADGDVVVLCGPKNGPLPHQDRLCRSLAPRLRGCRQRFGLRHGRWTAVCWGSTSVNAEGQSGQGRLPPMSGTWPLQAS